MPETAVLSWLSHSPAVLQKLETCREEIELATGICLPTPRLQVLLPAPCPFT